MLGHLKMQEKDTIKEQSLREGSDTGTTEVGVVVQGVNSLPGMPAFRMGQALAAPVQLFVNSLGKQ